MLSNYILFFLNFKKHILDFFKFYKINYVIVLELYYNTYKLFMKLVVVKNSKVIAILLVGVVGLMMTSHPVYAHEFSGNEESAWLAKVQNIKAEMSALKMDAGDSEAIDWHVDKLGEYWTDDDTKEMGERNELLAKEIPDSINSIITAAKSSSPNSADIAKKITTLNGYLDESVSARLNKADLKNGTIQAFAVTGIITETLEDYAEAIGTDQDLNDMEGMSHDDHEATDNMDGMDHGSGEMKTESTTLHIVEGSSTSDAKCTGDNSCFGAASLTITPGTKVTWVNDDTAAHTITSGTPTDGPDGTFDSSLLPAGKSYSFTFDDEGTFAYFCQVHPWMTGTIIVKAGTMKGMSYDENDNAPITYIADMSSDVHDMDGMSGMSTGETNVPIENMAAYHSAQALSAAARDYYHNTVLPLASGEDVKPAQAADAALSDLVDAINKKSDAGTIMEIVHLHTHPNLITAYKLPEFPLPVLLVIIAMVGVMAATRFGTKLRYS